MHPEAIPAAVIFVGAFLVGLRSTQSLIRTYRAIASSLKPRHALIGQAFVVTAVSITTMAGLVGAFTVWRMLGGDRLEWSPFVVFPVVIVVLFIPRYLEWVWAQIGGAR